MTNKLRIKFWSLAPFILVVACSPKSPLTKSDSAQSAAGITGGYDLPQNLIVGSCPFLHETNSLDPVLRQLQAQLEIKIEGENTCMAEQKVLYQHLNTIQDYYGQIDDSLATKKGAEVYQNFLLDLEAQLQDLNSKGLGSSDEATLVRNGIYDVQGRVRDLSVQKDTEQINFKERQKANFRRDLFLLLNDTFVSMEKMNPKCMARLGGWNQLLPPLLGIASLASGVSVFASQALVGAGLQVATGLVTLLQHQDARNAFREIITLNNQKVLACTYYSLQHSTCELRRGLRMATEKRPEIVKSLTSPPQAGTPADWQKFLQLYAELPDLQPILEAIATQGSSLSLDPAQVYQYFTALKVNPMNLPPAPIPTASDSEKQKWLQTVGRAGIGVSSRDNFGKPLGVDEQINNALTEIKNHISTIELVQDNLKENKSFEALRHSLLAKSPQLPRLAKALRVFLLEQATKLNAAERGAVLMSAQMMDKLEKFATVKITDESKIDDYLQDLSTAGGELFSSIARGSVAQITKQEVLALGGKSYERILNAFQSIENRFILADVNNRVPYEKSFLSYKQEKLLFYRLSQIFSDIRGTGAIFRDSEIEAAYSSFESGFGEDLLQMLESSLDLRSTRAPELQQASAPHFCSLLSGFLKSADSSKSRSLLEQCQKRHKALQISTLYFESNEAIDYNDPCFYDNFIRKNKSIQILDWMKREQKTY